MFRGFGDKTLGHLGAVEPTEPVTAGVGGDEGEGAGSDPPGGQELESRTSDLDFKSTAAKVACELVEDGEPYLASVLGLVSTFFSRSSVIFLPAMLCVSKAAVRFSTTAARKCAVPFITPSLMV